MAAQSDSVARQRLKSATFLKYAIGIVKQKMFGDESDGSSETDELTDRVTAEVPAISAELEQLLSRHEQSHAPAEKAWAQLAGDTATLGTYLTGFLRQSLASLGIGHLYSRVRTVMLNELVKIGGEDAKCPGFVWQVLGPVLLGMDTLESYARILANAAEQLRPAAALQLTAELQDSGSAGASGAGQPQGSVAASGPRERQVDLWRQRQRRGEQGYWFETPTLEDVEDLLGEPLVLLAILGMAVNERRCAGADTACGSTYGGSAVSSSSTGSDKGAVGSMSSGRASGNGTSGSGSSGGGGGAGGSRGSSSGGEGGEGGGGSGATTPSLGTRCMLTWTPDKLHSSYVLEHWARLLLLGTSAAVARGDGMQQREAQAVQARSLDRLSDPFLMLGLGLDGLVLRPCGRALAATHMAYLCAALDGGGAFGLTRPAEIVLPACKLHTKEYLQHADPTAVAFDAGLRKRGCSVGLRPAVYILKAWMWLMWSKDPAEPRAGGGVGPGGEGCSSSAVPPLPEGDGAGEQGLQEEGQAHRVPDVPSAGPCSLPPYNRSATVALCLRLVKGVLARWGEVIPGARLDKDGRDGGSSSSGSGPQLPKLGGCAVLYEALACSRLALLQEVEGRERVPRRTREQLRAWWETYVAAAQHPEALAVGVPEDDNPEEDDDDDARGTEEGPPVRPSADTVAALEAGLLPCMSRLVTRMGAGTSEGAVWSPPLRYPTFQVRWSEVMLHGQLGQVGELVAATSRRARLAVGELRAVVAAAGKAGRCRGRGRSVDWLAGVTHEVLTFAEGRLRDLGFEVLGCGEAADGSHQQGGGVGMACGTAEEQGVAGAGGASSPADSDERQHVGGSDQQRTGAEEEQGEAGAGGASRPTGVEGGQQTPRAVRYSYAAAELLPPISAGVQLYAELDGREDGGGGQGHGHGAVGDAAWEASAQLICSVSPSLLTALECTTLILAKCIRAAAQQHGAVAGAGDGGGAGSVSSGSGGGVGGSALAGGGPNTPWRQLLLGDVRLMGLMGAAMQLWGETEAAHKWAKHIAQDDQDDARQYDLMGELLSAAMVLSAVAFPPEFRAAAGGNRTAAATAEPRAVPEAVAAAAGKRGAGGGGTGRSSGSPCIDLDGARAAMEAAGFGDGVEVVNRMLGGWEPTAGEAWELASSCLGRCGFAAEELPGMLDALVPPAEARAAVAAAAAV